MSPLERIEALKEKYRYHSLIVDPVIWEEIVFLLQAFGVLHNVSKLELFMSLDNVPMLEIEKILREEFEKAMKDSRPSGL